MDNDHAGRPRRPAQHTEAALGVMAEQWEDSSRADKVALAMDITWAS